MAGKSRTWDVAYDDDVDEFGPAGFDEEGLDAYSRNQFDETGQLRTLSLEEGEAGLEQYLVDRWLKGSMSAREVCTLAYWASAAGASGFVKKLAFRPDAPTGHFSRHLRTVLRMNQLEKEQMSISVPCYSKTEFERSLMDLPCVPVFESLARELSDTPAMATQLEHMVQSKVFPPIVTEHCLFKSSSGRSLPTVLYVDAVPISKHESLMGFWVHTLVSLRRHLCCVIRKSRLCQCGCKGWCTIWCVMHWLQWNFLALASGEYPSNMPNGATWGESSRRDRSGSPLGFTACLVAIVGDWAEFAHTFGVPNWQSNLAPCPHCCCKKHEMHEDDSLSPLVSPWPDLTHDEYDRAATTCEIHVVLDAATHREIKRNLIYEATKSGSHGRSLAVDLPEFHLRAGDRLEPSCTVPDTGAGFDEARLFPLEVTFWRVSLETRTKHRNPLYNHSIGITVALLLVDMLHCFYLGLLQGFSKDLLWELILCDSWDTQPGRNYEEQVSVSVRLLAIELLSFYDSWGDAHKGSELTRLQAFTLSMIGTRDARCLKLKGSEAKGFFFFLTTLLERRGAKLARHDVWKQAADALLLIISVTTRTGFRVPPAAFQVFAFVQEHGGNLH